MGFSLGKSFNKVAQFALHPSAMLNKVGLDVVDKGLQGFGLDLFGNKQQDFNNQIAKENNSLQKDAFNFNKSMATDVYNTNKDIAYNGSQIKSADMAKAGLNPLAGVNSSPQTVSSSNVEGPNLSQSNSVAQTGLQKIQTIAGLAMQAKQLESSLASSAIQDKAVQAQTRYQELVNDYFDEHHVLPTQQNEWIAQILPLLDKYGDNVKNLPQSFVDALNDFKAQKQQQKIDKIVQKNEKKTEQSYTKGKTDSFYNKKTIDSAKYEISKYPPNEKGFIDWRNSRQGQEMIKLYGYLSAREYFFEETENFRKYNK